MTSAVVSAILWLFRLFGVNLSGFAGGAILAAVAATAFAGYSGYVFHAGIEHAESKCEAAALTKQNAELQAQLAEARRQLDIANAVQQADAARAADAETKLRDNESNVNATPANTGACLNRLGAGRVRAVR